MLWAYNLPINITLGLMALLVVLLTVFAPRLKWKRGRTFLIGSGVALIAFVPTCGVTKLALDTQRFGIRTYATAAEANEYHLKRYMPPAATDITVELRENCYTARFKIDKKDIESWFNEAYDDFARLNPVEYKQRNLSELRGRHAELPPSYLDTMQFGKLGWKAVGDLISYPGPWQANGSGSQLYYAEAEGVAYQYVGYW